MNTEQTPPQEPISQMIATFLSTLTDSEWQPPYAHSLAMVVYRLARGETEQAQQSMAEALAHLALESVSEDFTDIPVELANVALHAHAGLVTGTLKYEKGGTPTAFDFRVPYTSEAMELYGSDPDGEA